jgi:hypothetical protein
MIMIAATINIGISKALKIAKTAAAEPTEDES